MTVTAIEKDREALRMTLTAAFDAPVERVWQLWADPRLLERWWGPPEYPATFVDHDLAAGGKVTYYMTGPDGERFGGWWRVEVVEPPHLLEFEDGFADADGRPNPDMPTTRATVSIGPSSTGGTVMTIASSFPSTEAFDQIIAMGMEEGLGAAVGQMDALLAGDVRA